MFKQVTSELLMVRPSNFSSNYETLKTNNSDVELFLFDGGHEIPYDLIKTIEKALNQWLV